MERLAERWAPGGTRRFRGFLGGLAGIPVQFREVPDPPVTSNYIKRSITPDIATNIRHTTKHSKGIPLESNAYEVEKVLELTPTYVGASIISFTLIIRGGVNESSRLDLRR